MTDSPHSLPPGLYQMKVNGNVMGTIKVRGLITDGIDAARLAHDFRVVQGDVIEYVQLMEDK